MKRLVLRRKLVAPPAPPPPRNTAIVHPGFVEPLYDHSIVFTLKEATTDGIKYCTGYYRGSSFWTQDGKRAWGPNEVKSWVYLKIPPVKTTRLYADW